MEITVWNLYLSIWLIFGMFCIGENLISFDGEEIRLGALIFLSNENG